VALTAKNAEFLGRVQRFYNGPFENLRVRIPVAEALEATIAIRKFRALCGHFLRVLCG
jgi:hypothetical protein